MDSEWGKCPKHRLGDSPEPEGLGRRQQDEEEVVTTPTASSDSEMSGPSQHDEQKEMEKSLKSVVSLGRGVANQTTEDSGSPYKGWKHSQLGKENERSQGCGCSYSRALSSLCVRPKLRWGWGR